MLRTLHWKWVGLLALTLAPGLVRAQTVSPASHTVRDGDTLWDLAKQYRGDPFLWPDIYRMNTSVVEDPHWIYPGEILRLAGADTVPAVPTTDTPTTPAAPAAVAETPAQADTAIGTVAEAPAADAAAPQQTLAQLTAVSATQPGEEAQGLFGQRRAAMLQESLKAYTHQPYRALRRSEFYSSGFLTEKQVMPFGKVLGVTYPQQIRANGANANAQPYSTIAIEAPRGATYQVGDTLLLLQLGREIESHGDIVIPTGLAQIVDTVQGRYVASVVATYGPIRSGQRALPAEKFTPSGEAHATAVSDGVRATFLGGPNRQDLKAPQMVVFLDKGREDGVAPGDIFEIRRRAAASARWHPAHQRRDGHAAGGPRQRSLRHGPPLNILSPDIPPGTDARQVAKLPS